MEEKKYLPIGSVVILKTSKKRFIIIGYKIKNNEEIYDYSACLFPKGIVSLNDLIVFNHNDIEEICFIGYKNDDYNNINEILNK